MGGGALFFFLLPKKAILLDNNYELINCYKVIKRNVNELVECLKDEHEAWIAIYNKHIPSSNS